MYVRTISYGTACMCGIYLYPASLTLSLAAMSAPFCRRSAQVPVRPFQAAICRADHPRYNNRETETEREIGQGRDNTGEKHHDRVRQGQGKTRVRVG